MNDSIPAAQCGHHPEREADGGTCERCGTFLCQECRVETAEPPTCVPCLALLDRGPHLRHARVLSIVMIAHGALLAAMGAYYVLFGGMLFGEYTGQPADPSTSELPYLGEWMSLFIALLGVVNVAPGILQVVAGWQLLRLRHLSLSWIALIAGMLSLFGCYCFPSAIVLLALGAWILTRDDVRARFRIRVSPATSTP
ncbi:MAG: hypothetical protein AB8I08_34380 [Sandaracinaceae bacterium]